MGEVSTQLSPTPPKQRNKQNQSWREKGPWAGFQPHTPPWQLQMHSIMTESIQGLAMGVLFLLWFSCVAVAMLGLRYVFKSIIRLY